jgi:hypothetical protein
MTFTLMTMNALRYGANGCTRTNLKKTYRQPAANKAAHGGNDVAFSCALEA